MSPLLGQRQAMLQSRSSGAPAQLPACGRRAVPKAALRAAHSHQPLAHCCPVAPQLHHRSPLQRQQQAAALGQACAGPQHSSSSRPQARVHAAAADGGDASAAAATQQGTSSFTQAVFNVVNVMMGVGLLSLPFALKSSGWIGILLLWVMGFVTNYTGKALVECANVVAKRRGAPGAVMGYEDIAEESFGKLGRLLISSIIYVELFGTCCLLFILEGDNLFKLLGTKLAANASQYMWIAAAIMIPTVWLPDLKALSVLGMVGVSVTTTVVLSVAYTLFTGNFPVGAPTDVALWSTLPLVFGIMTFCYSGHGVFPAIQASMKEPSRFPQVLNTAFLIVAFLCSFIGGAGYYMYGTHAADVVIFNLPLVLATLCSSLVLITPPAKFALTMEPVAAAAQQAASGALLGGRPLLGLPRALLRTAVALAILVAARSVPFLAYLMALVGSFMTVSVSVTFPALCHLTLVKGQSAASKAWNWFVVALGLVCTVLGTAASMRSLANKAAEVAAGAV